MIALFFVVVGAAAMTVHPAADRLSSRSRTRAIALVVAQLPAGAAQPRVRELANRINAVLKAVPGIKGWITSGGFSDPDGANLSNVITEYVMYEDWGKRSVSRSQPMIIADLRERLRAIRIAEFDVLIPPPIAGLGQAGGFQMMVEDRTGVGLGELAKATQAVLLASDKQPALRDVNTTFNASSPQLQLDINRTMAESLGVPINNIFDTLETYLRFDLRQSLQQV